MEDNNGKVLQITGWCSRENYRKITLYALDRIACTEIKIVVTFFVSNCIIVPFTRSFFFFFFTSDCTILADKSFYLYLFLFVKLTHSHAVSGAIASGILPSAGRTVAPSILNYPNMIFTEHVIQYIFSQWLWRRILSTSPLSRGCLSRWQNPARTRDTKKPWWLRRS